MNNFKTVSQKIKEFLEQNKKMTLAADSLLKELASTDDSEKATAIMEAITNGDVIKSSEIVDKIVLRIVCEVASTLYTEKLFKSICKHEILTSPVERELAGQALDNILGSNINISTESLLKLESNLESVMLLNRDNEEIFNIVKSWHSSVMQKLQFSGLDPKIEIRRLTSKFIYDNYDVTGDVIKYLNRCDKGLINDPQRGHLAAILAYIQKQNLPRFKEAYQNERNDMQNYVKCVKLRKREKRELLDSINQGKHSYKLKKSNAKSAIIDYLVYAVNLESILGAKLVIENPLKIKQFPKKLYDDAVLILAQQ